MVLIYDDSVLWLSTPVLMTLAKVATRSPRRLVTLVPVLPAVSCDPTNVKTILIEQVSSVLPHKFSRDAREVQDSLTRNEMSHLCSSISPIHVSLILYRESIIDKCYGVRQSRARPLSPQHRPRFSSAQPFCSSSTRILAFFNHAF